MTHPPDKKGHNRWESSPETEYPIIVLRAIKDVKIINYEGDATINWHRECMNNCDKAIPRLVHKGRYDGTLKSSSLLVNGKKADYTLQKFVKREINGKTKPEVPLSHEFRLAINLEKEEIQAGQSFRYEYTVEHKEVFKNMCMKCEEYTGYEVLVPTDHLTIVMTSPEGSKFDPKAWEVRVTGLYELEDFREEKRCREEYQPTFLQGGRLLLWDIKRPKIACTYLLHFTVRR